MFAGDQIFRLQTVSVLHSNSNILSTILTTRELFGIICSLPVLLLWMVHWDIQFFGCMLIVVNPTIPGTSHKGFLTVWLDSSNL